MFDAFVIGRLHYYVDSFSHICTRDLAADRIALPARMLLQGDELVLYSHPHNLFREGLGELLFVFHPYKIPRIAVQSRITSAHSFTFWAMGEQAEQERFVFSARYEEASRLRQALRRFLMDNGYRKQPSSDEKALYIYHG